MSVLHTTTLQTRRNESFRKNITIPPWLWFFFNIPLLYSLPNQVTEWKIYYRELLSTSPDIFLLKLVDYPDIILSLVLFIGATRVLFPKFSAILFERSFKLDDLDSSLSEISLIYSQPFCEIENFLKSHVPNLRIKVNFRLFNQDPFLYASSYHKTYIALFPNIIIMWKKDQAVTKSILLHEIGHYLNGDVPLVNAISAFEWVFRSCLSATVLFFLTPIVAFIINQIYIYRYHELSVSIILFEFNKIFFDIIPNAFLNQLELFLKVLILLIFPIVGVWCSEFNCDKFMVDLSSDPYSAANAIDRISGEISSIRRFLSHIFHPPMCFRKWMSIDVNETESKIVFFLMFQFAFLLQLLIYLIWTFLNNIDIYIEGRYEFIDILNKLAFDAGIYLKEISIVWILSLVLILLFQIISFYGDKSFSRVHNTSIWDYINRYMVTVGAALCLLVAGYLI